MAYGSKSLKGSELNYGAHMLEFLALDWAITKKQSSSMTACMVPNFSLLQMTTCWRMFYLPQNWMLQAIIWYAEWSAYNFEIKYKVGRNNIDADVLSRVPYTPGWQLGGKHAMKCGSDPVYNRTCPCSRKLV